MSTIRKFVAPEFIFGPSAIEQTMRYVRNFGAQKPLVVSDPGVIAAGWTQKVIDMLTRDGIDCTLFSRISPNPRDYEVMEGARFYDKQGCDLIIAIGGGSVMDSAKAIGIVSTNQTDVKDFEGVDNVEIPGPPLICIPTTAGTSADISQFSVINNTQKKVKFAIISTTMVPDVALVDPMLTMSMSPFLTACTGMDALVHALEAFVSSASSPMTDLHALEALRLLKTHLPHIIENPNDVQTRSHIMQGSLQAGLAFSNASLGAGHSLAHSLGGYLDLPHGECNAILIDHVIAFNYPKAPERYDQIGHALGLDLKGKSSTERAYTIIEDIRQLKSLLGIKETLGSKGLKKTDITFLARNAILDPCLITNPRDANQRDLEVIYEEAL